MVLHTRGRVGSRRFYQKREDLVSEMLARSFCILLLVERGSVMSGGFKRILEGARGQERMQEGLYGIEEAF